MIKIIFYSSVIALLFSSCKQPRHGSLTVNLKDGPAALDEINIDLEAIEAYVVSSTESGWHRLSTNKGIYNILLFQNSSALVATQNEIPEGKVSLLKLVLGNNNSVRVGDEYKPLLTRHYPGEKFTVIIPTDCVIEPNNRVDLLLDIDAERSITKTLSGNFQFHPVAASGVIEAPLEIY